MLNFSWVDVKLNTKLMSELGPSWATVNIPNNNTNMFILTIIDYNTFYRN
jgi:hypothetical protein